MLLLSVFLGLVPGFAWLIFYLSEDPHPEPKPLIVYTFIVGIVSGFFTIIIEELFNAATAAAGAPSLTAITQQIQNSVAGIAASTFLQLISLLLGLAAIEELMKFGAAYFAVGKNKVLIDPIDAMIYMIVAALGFATLENIGAITNVAAAAASGQGAIFVSVFETVSLRFVGATLLHSLTSAIVGYHWALGIMHKKVPHYIIAGFIFATILHASFNYLILNYAPIGYSVLFLLVIGFFVLNDFEKIKVAEAV